MRVFVTGATGFIGSAIVQELLKAGHQVIGLTRSEAGEQSLHAAGAKVHRGDLEDLESLRRGAAMADGVIHTAFIHDFSNFKANCEIDGRAIEALGSALAGSDRPLVITSGIGVLTPGHVLSEADKPAANMPRAASEQAAAALTAKGIRSVVVRLPPSVHDKSDHGFVPFLINIAREKGVSAYIGEGLNRWPAVHRLDAAHVFRLALEKAKAGSILHAIGDEGIPTKDIATVIGQHLNIPVVSKSPEEAAAHFNWIAHFFALNIPAIGKQTQESLDWRPGHPGLIADLEQGHYFTK